jgi:hypothetical protein
MTVHGAEVDAGIDGYTDADADVLGDSSSWSAPVLSVLSVLQAASATSSTELPKNLPTARDEVARITAED